MNATSRARIHEGLVVTALAAVAIASGATANQPAGQPAATRAAAPATSTAQYLANASVLVSHGDTKVVFDPLFRNDFGQYALVPAQVERALFDGTAPFDGLDAVFVSHYHEDHFSAVDVLRLLEARKDLRLFAPAQAVAGMREISAARLAAVAPRVHAIALAYQDAPVTLGQSSLMVEAVRIPHSGWPTRQQQVENIAFRVTLDATTTVVHLGDADTSDAHFARDDAYWRRRRALDWRARAGECAEPERSACTGAAGARPVHRAWRSSGHPVASAPPRAPHERAKTVRGSGGKACGRRCRTLAAGAW